MSKYVKYTGKILLLGVLLLLMLAVVSAVVNPKDCSEAAGMQEPQAHAVAAEPENTLDVVVVGDSISACAIAPLKMYEQEGFTSYQCSYKAQRLCLTSFMIRLALEKQKPEVVVIEADNLFYDMSAVRAVGSVAMKIFPIVQYHDRWKRLTLKDFTQFPSYATSDVDKGYTARFSWDAAEFPNDFALEKTDPVPMTQLNKLFLDDVVSCIKQNGCKIVVVATPNPTIWSMGHHNEVAQYCQSNQIDFLDMNMPDVMEQVGLDYSLDTQDKGEHLNARGGMKVSAWLAAALKSKYGLTDHRQDPAYQSWNAATSDFMTRMNTAEYAPFDWSKVEVGVERL